MTAPRVIDPAGVPGGAAGGDRRRDAAHPEVEHKREEGVSTHGATCIFDA